MNKWFVELEVDQAARDDLALLGEDKCLREVPASWAPKAGTSWAISMAEWCELQSPGDVSRCAAEVLSKLNDILQQDSALHSPVRTTGCVWEADPSSDGGFRRHFRFELGTGVLALSGSNLELRINGFTVAPPRTRGLRQRELRDRDPNFDTACRLYEAAGEDIRLLWLAFEYARSTYGNLLTGLNIPRQEIAAFCETANDRPHVRHVGKSTGHTYPEVSGSDARKLIEKILVAWLDLRNRY